MIDIRDHGGSFGSGERVNGEKVSLLADTEISKGDFISFITSSETANIPTANSIQNGYLYIPSDTMSTDYSNFRSITSDKGHTIMIRGYTYNTRKYVLKPYMDSGGKLSAINYSFTIDGWLYSITKITGNIFVIFHSTTSESYGVRASFIKIDDDTGEPSLLSTIVIFSTEYFKNFYYIPSDDTNLSGVVLYNKGRYTSGTSDNVTLYMGNMNISYDFTNLSFPVINTNIKYTAGESYGNVMSLRYLSDDTGIIFNSHGNSYKLTWDNVITTVATGISSSNFSSDSIVFNIKHENRLLAITQNGTVMNYVYDPTTNVTTATSLNSASYYKILETIYGVFDRGFLTKNGVQINPQLRNVFKPIGNNAFITLGATGNFNAPGNAIVTLVFYMSYDFKTVIALSRSSTITTASQYIDGGIWADIDDNLLAKMVYTAYSYYEGSGSFRYKYSAIAQLNSNVSTMRVTNNSRTSHGISTTSGKSGDLLKCIINKLIDTKFL